MAYPNIDIVQLPNHLEHNPAYITFRDALRKESIEEILKDDSVVQEEIARIKDILFNPRHGQQVMHAVDAMAHLQNRRDAMNEATRGLFDEVSGGFSSFFARQMPQMPPNFDFGPANRADINELEYRLRGNEQFLTGPNFQRIYQSAVPNIPAAWWEQEPAFLQGADWPSAYAKLAKDIAPVYGD